MQFDWAYTFPIEECNPVWDFLTEGAVTFVYVTQPYLFLDCCHMSEPFTTELELCRLVLEVEPDVSVSESSWGMIKVLIASRTCPTVG